MVEQCLKPSTPTHFRHQIWGGRRPTTNPKHEADIHANSTAVISQVCDGERVDRVFVCEGLALSLMLKVVDVVVHRDF